MEPVKAAATSEAEPVKSTAVLLRVMLPLVLSLIDFNWARVWLFDKETLTGQAVVYIQSVDGSGVNNPKLFVYSMHGAIELLCRPIPEGFSRQQINEVLFHRP